MLMATVSFSATNNRTYTIGSAGDYPTLAAAEADTEQDLVSNDSSITFQFIGGSWADQSATTIDGSVSNATHFMTVTAIGDARHNGIWDASGAVRFSAGFQPFKVADDFCVVDGIQVIVTGTADFRNVLDAFTGGGTTVKNCIIRSTSTGSKAIGIFAGGSVDVFIFNNIIYDVNGIGIKIFTGDNNGWVYNNTLHNCDTALWTSFHDGQFVNNMAFGSIDVLIGSPSTVNLSHNNATNNGSITYTSCGSCGADDVLSISDPFNNISGDDFSYASGTSDGVEDGSAESGVVTDDIIGTSRPQSTNWDIGAFEFESGEPPDDPDISHVRRIKERKR